MAAHFTVPKLKIDDKLGNYILIATLSPLLLAIILMIIKFETGVHIPFVIITYCGIPALLFIITFIIFGGAALWLYKRHLQIRKNQKWLDTVWLDGFAWCMNGVLVSIIMNLYLDGIHPFQEINDSFVAMIAVSLFIGFWYGQLIKALIKNLIEFNN